MVSEAGSLTAGPVGGVPVLVAVLTIPAKVNLWAKSTIGLILPPMSTIPLMLFAAFLNPAEAA